MVGLIIVDAQNDFGKPGGALYCQDGENLIPIINREIDWLGSDVLGSDALVITTQDWHPAVTKHFDKWPVHCVAGTVGSDLMDGLQLPLTTKRFFKGQGYLDDGYSAFEAALDATENSRLLHNVLQDRGIKRLYVCGIATDYCVKATVLDAVKLGYKVALLKNACVGVSPETAEAAIAEMYKAGVMIIKTF